MEIYVPHLEEGLICGDEVMDASGNMFFYSAEEAFLLLVNTMIDKGWLQFQLYLNKLPKEERENVTRANFRAFVVSKIREGGNDFEKLCEIYDKLYSKYGDRDYYSGGVLNLTRTP